MKFVALLLSLVVAAFAAPQGNNVSIPSGAGLTSGPGSTDGGAGEAEGDLVNGEGAQTECQEGEVLHADGTCVTPEVTRKIYEFNVPKQERPVSPAPSIPPPAVDHNIFVRLPEEAPASDPIVLPPPRQNNILYVISKQEEQTHQVIQVQAQPQADPEIYFVNYQDGENPTLPLGVDLETALSVAVAAGCQGLGGVDGAGGEAGVGGAAGFGGVGGLGGAGRITEGHGSNGKLGGVNGAGVGVGVNGGAGGFQTGSGERPAGLDTTP
ncbi:ATP-dependent RNA helicase A-like [Penaeus chinensis]|uniref:ATP-dependent RNA helicase A-like n=1 Tax=Penaeus chinensis TaxID=139456 RepID=UPI001FB79E6B|nr:ATP-dependent RNA helicase A-like [Penaeus chinensis]